MNYFEFHLMFILPALLFVIFLWSQVQRERRGLLLKPLGLLSLLAFFYTTPWDNFIVAREVWSYPEGSVLGTWGYVPYEEYAFFLLQTWIVGVFSFFVSEKFLRIKPAAQTPSITESLVGVLLGGLVFLVGCYFLWRVGDQGFYLGMILVWVGPVWGLQWAFGWKNLIQNWKLFLVSVAVPSTYLSLADWFAVRMGTWSISEKLTLGYGLKGLPIEEIIFFWSASLMVTQGLILYFSLQHLLQGSLPRNIRQQGQS